MKKIVILVVIIFFISCSNDDNSISCDRVIVDAQKYTTLQSDSYELIEVSEEDACLKLSIRYGGGCEDISAILIDSEDIIESNPPQRNLRLVLTTQEDACEAVITEEFLFDISSLQVENATSVRLNFQDSGITYLYAY